MENKVKSALLIHGDQTSQEDVQFMGAIFDKLAQLGYGVYWAKESDAEAYVGIKPNLVFLFESVAASRSIGLQDFFKKKDVSVIEKLYLTTSLVSQIPSMQTVDDIVKNFGLSTKGRFY